MNKALLIIFTFLLSSIIGLLQAQVDLYNTATLYVASSTDTVYINGNFTNTSAADLTNNGNFYIKQNLTNDQASMSTGTGTLYLNGSAAQLVDGSQLFKTYNMVSDNSAGITLNNDISVAGNHTFSNGIINTSATPNYLIYESGSSYTGSSDASHVNGWVKKIGSTDFIFPVGNAIYLRPAAIESLTSSSEFNARHNEPTPNTHQTQLPIVTVDVYEFWELKKISGGSASVHLNWDNTKITFPAYNLSDIAVSYHNGSNWTDQGGTATGDPGIAGDVTSNSISSFGNFAIASKTFPLPLKFLSFTAQRKKDFIELKWVTAEEVNTDHFEIERSKNGVQFTVLASMPTMNSSNVQEYFYIDHTYDAGIVYYRIRCIDKDGKSKLSRVIAVYGNSILKKNIQAINPVADKIIIRSEMDDTEPTAYVLYNQAGSTILKGWLKLKVGMDNTIRLSFKPAKGIYFLKLIRTNQEFIQKLIIN